MSLDNVLEFLLFRYLANRVLMAGGALSVSGVRWTKRETDDGGGVVARIEGTDQTRAWSITDYVVDDVCNTVAMRRESLDSVAIYGKGDTGVTWRMLKADCPYLSMVFGNDTKTMKVLDARVDYLNSLLDKALNQEEKYDNRN